MECSVFHLFLILSSRDNVPQLYTILPEKKVDKVASAVMGSTHVYEIPSVRTLLLLWCFFSVPHMEIKLKLFAINFFELIIVISRTIHSCKFCASIKMFDALSYFIPNGCVVGWRKVSKGYRWSADCFGPAGLGARPGWKDSPSSVGAEDARGIKYL